MKRAVLSDEINLSKLEGRMPKLNNKGIVPNNVASGAIAVKGIIDIPLP